MVATRKIAPLRADKKEETTDRYDEKGSTMRLEILVPIALVMGLVVGLLVASRVWVTAPLGKRTSTRAWAGFTGVLAATTAVLCVGFLLLIVTLLVLNLGAAVEALFS